MGIGERLAKTTADLDAALTSGVADRDRGGKVPAARTAPGQMLAVQAGITELKDELEVLRGRLRDFDGSLVARQVDPGSIKASRWANRHEASFSTAAFAALKASIEHAGGNTQPILVRDHGAGQYEIVFGHRRHRACLELGLPVFAVVADGSLGDLEVFLSMERENRDRADLSPYEQGVSYLAAIESGLFPSVRRLAEARGATPTRGGATVPFPS
jgi:ParB family chromosome partitioning protein